MKILVVEDDPVSRKVINTVLEKQGFSVIEAESAEQGLDLLKSKKTVDLIISDINMPEMSGFEFLKILKSDDIYRRIPVILCTSADDAQSVVKALSLGVDDYITKPVKADILKSKVEKLRKKIPGAILVVDDEDLFREYLAEVIKMSGFKSVQAASGQEALDMIEKSKISLIISDVKMPEMSGLELLEKTKTSHPKIPLLLMSGYADKHLTKTESDVSPDGFIAKPFHNREIISKIEQLVKVA